MSMLRLLCAKIFLQSIQLERKVRNGFALCPRFGRETVLKSKNMQKRRSNELNVLTKCIINLASVEFSSF